MTAFFVIKSAIFRHKPLKAVVLILKYISYLILITLLKLSTINHLVEFSRVENRFKMGRIALFQVFFISATIPMVLTCGSRVGSSEQTISAVSPKYNFSVGDDKLRKSYLI